MQEFESLKELRDHLELAKKPLTGCAFQNLDLRGFTRELLSTSLEGSVFLGCQLEPEAERHALRSHALIFPEIPHLPFKPYRSELYSVAELYAGYAPGGPPDRYERTPDHVIYRYFDERRKLQGGANLLDTLAQRLHDQSVTDALNEFLGERKVVAIMGGHKMARDAEEYWSVVHMASELTRRGFLVASGGGPGAMEAAHLGAWLSTCSEEQQREAVKLLARVKTYDEHKVGWLDTAFEVRERFPLNPTAVEQSRSLSIPTWHYGHEPPNAFATDIAKYFENSVREEGLLAIANYGVVFTPGSAGTIQEIFQDACQNHYAEKGKASPMVFFDNAKCSYWMEEKPVLAVLEKLGQELKDGQPREYVRWLKHTNQVDEVIRHIELFAAHPPSRQNAA